MSGNIRPIDTVYNGYRFRSRLEARWAVFLDALDVPYEYERQGYDLDGLAYLPDFWLPEQQCWLEIKGEEPTPEERRKAQLLANGTGHPVYVFAGDISIPSPNTPAPTASAYLPGNTTEPPRPNRYGLMWCQCPLCGDYGIAEDGLADLMVSWSGCGCGGVDSDHYDTYDAPGIVSAYFAARAARFDGRSPGNPHGRGRGAPHGR